MALVRWNPIMRSLGRWPDFWDDDDLSLVNHGTNNLDVYETENEVVVKANVAGVPAESVDITFEKGVLFIKAEKSDEEEDKDKQHYSRSSWSYSYRVAVPGVSMLDSNVEPEAEIEDGVVEVRFKKAEASKPKKLSVKAKSKKNK